MRTELGEIKSVSFGYQDYLYGLILTLGGVGWQVNAFYCYNPSYKGQDNINYLLEMTIKIQELLKDAKSDTIDKLLNKPILCQFEGKLLKDFRILKEVL